MHGCGGGATCWEVEQALKLSHQTASPRIWELKRLGLVVATGARRKTGSGRGAEVLVAPRVVVDAAVGAARAPTLRERVRELEAALADRDRAIARLQMQLALRDRKRVVGVRQMPLRGLGRDRDPEGEDPEG